MCLISHISKAYYYYNFYSELVIHSISKQMSALSVGSVSCFDICNCRSLSISIHLFPCPFQEVGVFIIFTPGDLRAMHWPDRWASH